jgi:hypothetical protein
MQSQEVRMKCNDCAKHITAEEKGINANNLRYFWCPSLGTVIFPEIDHYCCIVRRATAPQDEPKTH